MIEFDIARKADIEHPALSQLHKAVVPLGLRFVLREFNSGYRAARLGNTSGAATRANRLGLVAGRQVNTLQRRARRARSALQQAALQRVSALNRNVNDNIRAGGPGAGRVWVPGFRRDGKWVSGYYRSAG